MNITSVARTILDPFGPLVVVTSTWAIPWALAVEVLTTADIYGPAEFGEVFE